jgi:hypothetical protein
MWDDTGRERQPMTYRFRTLPIPGYEEYGMRDDGWSPSAEHTIVVLGDSFTFGATVNREDIWCEQIEARNPGLDMLNLATGGGIAKAYAEYTVLKDRLPSHEAVLFEMYLGNEFLDNYVWPDALKNVNEEIQEHYANYRRARLRGTSKSLFMAFQVASQIKWAIIGAYRSNSKSTYVPEKDGYWDERFGNFLLKPKNPIFLRYAEEVFTDDSIRQGIEDTEKNMVLLRDLVAGKRFVILLFPFKHQVHFDAIRDRVTGIDINKPNRIVLDLCRKHGITCVDLTEGLRRHSSERLYWDYDNHLTKLGQHYASLEAEQGLRKLGLLPSRP